ncbi:MAG: acyl-homoserine-lactone synthase [Rhodanobacter sp.]
MEILIGRRGQAHFSKEDELNMYRLRYQVFRERLQWDVPVVGDMEVDEFDDCDPVYVIAKEDEHIQGCWRLLPTKGAYMLRGVFPMLLHGKTPPCDDTVWELSRFTVCCKPNSFGFGEVALQMIEETLKFARMNGIRRYVTVTTPALERMLRSLGLRYERMGDPVRIGIELAVALDIDTSDQAGCFMSGPRSVGVRTRGQIQIQNNA